MGRLRRFVPLSGTGPGCIPGWFPNTLKLAAASALVALIGGVGVGVLVRSGQAATSTG